MLFKLVALTFEQKYTFSRVVTFARLHPDPTRTLP